MGNTPITKILAGAIVLALGLAMVLAPAAAYHGDGDHPHVCSNEHHDGTCPEGYACGVTVPGHWVSFPSPHWVPDQYGCLPVTPPTPTPTPAPSGSSSYLAVFTDSMWSWRCQLQNLEGGTGWIYAQNHTYLLTFTAPYQLDGAGVCAGVRGGDPNDWNLHADEQRLGGGAIAAFQVRNPEVGFLAYGAPRFGDVTLTIQEEHGAYLYSHTFHGPFKVLFPVGPAIAETI